MTHSISPSRPSDLVSPVEAYSFFRELTETVTCSQGRLPFLKRSLPDLVRVLNVGGAALVSQRQGGWKVESWAGTPQWPEAQSSHSSHYSQRVEKSTPPAMPLDLIASAVDRGAAVMHHSWMVVPSIAPSTEASQPVDRPTCLVLYLANDSASRSELSRTGEIFLRHVALAGQCQRQRERVHQLTQVLRASAQWQRNQLLPTSDEDSLLNEIAETAIKLLSCQRVSIFLWDKRRKKLVGKPSVGIEDPLVISDDAGIVGEVLATGEPKIWNGGDDDESRVNRSVDQSLDFQTTSLVAVPLIGQRGETIGVFEAINHQENSFTESHVSLLNDLALHAAGAIEALRAQKRLTASRDRLVRDAANSSPLVGEHPDIVAIRQSGTRVAGTDLTVMILGSNGTGKEVVARHIHYESDRRGEPFVAVNCAALVESLLESELFGHEKGSFTDANSTRVGKFELASGGTLFLDEVGDMSPGGQAKLLRVLEQREVVRVGGSVPIPVDVRVIAATNQPLEQLIAEKRFREDLFFRLNVVSLVLPDLAKRGTDILLLAEHFMQHFCYEIGRQVPTLAESAKAAMLSHPWPGNVRELRNTIERVCYLTSGDVIQAADLELRSMDGQALGGESSELASNNLNGIDSLAEATRQFQISHILSSIDRCSGNMTEAAERMELHRSNLYRKMKQLGMKTGEG
ncbi:sigma-54-dependent Fis family transcriptional regulator [Roseiconus lacunae]|uniref:sigma-54 interaction domain-containing protein n=1 Tax=Roseiconus lacunae TaxID=2605694 RepID=UPI003086DA43|nr:sigma-54-dependent Fis family transcriptional regulator [Stieleria sp. HD01]